MLQRLKNSYLSIGRWVKKHPIFSITLLALVIAAAIFTGGAILALPAVLAVATATGVIVIEVLLLIAATFLPLLSVSPDKDVKTNIAYFAGALSIMGMIAVIQLVPIVALIVFGITVVSGFAAVCAGIAAWIRSCNDENRHIKVTSSAVKEEQSLIPAGGSYAQLLPAVGAQPMLANAASNQSSVAKDSNIITLPTATASPAVESSLDDDAPQRSLKS